MTQLTIEIPGQLEPDRLEIDATDCVLLGRRAEVNNLAPGIEAPTGRARGHILSAPSVSGNHALVWRSADRVSIRDLGSRNGTWVRVPSGATISQSDALAVELRLAFPGLTPSEEEGPVPPRYRDESDFGDALAQCVSAWLRRHDVPAHVWAGPSSERSGPGGTTPLRLANGHLLWVQLDCTVDSTFHDRMVQVCRYVSTQNILFTAEVASRKEGMVLASPAIRMTHRRVVELAMQSLPSFVLLGPSGTGKECLAQAYHRHLGRSGGLVPINCATLTRERIVADLFGAEAGAYTGAHRTMIGAVERADGGTLFLDEVGELPPDVQPMLLRFLETGEYHRLGALGKARTADVRVVAATNRDLRQMVREGRFREDLFYRLALEIVDVPPLRDRQPDIEAYLRSQMLGVVSVYDALSPAALRALLDHAWGGNFRELVGLIRRIPRSAPATSITEDLVARLLATGSLSPVKISTPPPSSAGTDWISWLRESAESFMSDAGDAPHTWTDVTTFIEQYLKPWALANLAGLRDIEDLSQVSVSQTAEQVNADRGTVAKQLRRYLECRSPR